MITKEMKVAEVFESYPATQPIFKKFGFGALLNPILRNTFGRVTTLEKACKLHNVKLEDFLFFLKNALENNVQEIKVDENHSASDTVSLQPDELIQFNNILNTNIRTLIEHYPNVQKVFIKHFGEGCFTCPAFGMENAAFACSMHNTDPIIFAKECWEIIQQTKNASITPLVYISANQTINEIVNNHPETLKVFQKYGIDSCCGGNRHIKEAAVAHGINYQELANELINTMEMKR